MDEARAAIKVLFERMRIRRVVSIDDENVPAFEDVIGLCAELGDLAGQLVPEFSGLDFKAEPDEWRPELEQTWEAMPAAQRRDVVVQLSDERGDGTATFERMPVLRDLFEGYRFDAMSPQEWIEERDAILGSGKRTKVLLLFDQDLHEAGMPEDGGMRLIQEVLSSKGTNAFCGLLSHLFEASEEQVLWAKYAEDYHVPRDKFLLIAKERLNNNLLELARVIKLVAMNPGCTRLKSRVSNLIGKAHKVAAQQVEGINVYDLDHIVFRSSNREGVWEPDTLIRVFALFQRAEVLHQARLDTKLHDLASSIRGVSGVPTESTVAPERSAWKVHRLELYDSGEYINGLHLPLELGDIFEKTDNGKKFILLAQPCDLMVRSDTGRRKPSVIEAALVELTTARSERRRTLAREEHSDAYFTLEHFSDDDGSPLYISYRNSHIARLSILDLCAFRDDGTAAFTLGSSCPTGVIPAWQSYFGKVKRDFEKVINKYNSDDYKRQTKAIRETVIPSLCLRNLIRGQVDGDGNEVRYGLRRIGRLRQPHAGVAFTRYCNYVARAAFEHDFGWDDRPDGACEDEAVAE